MVRGAFQSIIRTTQQEIICTFNNTMKKCIMVSVFTQPDVNTRKVGRTRETSQVFTSGYVNTETISHFFYKITNERASSCNEGKRRACWLFGRFLNTRKIKLQKKTRKIFFHYCTQNKLKETELLLNKQQGELCEKIQYENLVYIRSCKMVLWPIRARVLFELFYNIRYLTKVT